MQLYADENFPLRVVEELRRLGHDMLTAQNDGRRSVPDPIILARAHALCRAVLTHNCWDFFQLDRAGLPHSGIVCCTRDDDPLALAARIHAALTGLSPSRWCLRVNRLP